jgi:hypothetical protein
MLPFQTENETPGNILQSNYRLLIVQLEVCHLSVDEETNGSYPFAKGLAY